MLQATVNVYAGLMLACHVIIGLSWWAWRGQKFWFAMAWPLALLADCIRAFVKGLRG